MDMDSAQLERAKRSLLRTVKKQRDTVAGSFTKTPSEATVNAIETYLDEWSKNLDELKQLDRLLMDKLDYTKLVTNAQIEEAEVAICKDYADSMHENCSQRAKLKTLAGTVRAERRRSEAFQSPDSHSATAPNPLSKLPDIKVPTFTGKIHDYTNWFALFSAVVDNNESLTDVHRMYYLKNALVGDAKDLLADYPITGDAYKPALDHVKTRYYNKRAIIADHFREFLDHPDVDVAHLRKSIDHLQAIERGLKTCAIDTAKMSPLLAFIVVRKLPEALRIDWENSIVDNSAYPNFDLLMTFLANRCFAYETFAVKPVPPCEPLRNDDSRRGRRNQRKSGNADEKANLLVKRCSNDTPAPTPPSSRQPYTPKCAECKGEHTLARCPNFERLTVEERKTYVAKAKLCENCLRPNHSVENCTSFGCRVCNQKHNTKLHRDAPEKRATSSDTQTAKTSLTVARPKPTTSLPLLPCAVVRVRITKDRDVLARAIIDPGSQAHLVTESFVRRNRLATLPTKSNIACVGPGVSSSQSVELTVASRISDYTTSFNADVVGRLPYDVAAKSIQIAAQLNPALQLADTGVEFTHADILIGVQLSNRIMSGEKKFVDETCFENSPFGWVVSGPIDDSVLLPEKCCCLSVNVQDALAQFWEVEHVDAPSKTSSEFELIEAHFESTYTRLPDGRFQVRLPFKSSLERLANTYAQARSALLRAERVSSPEIRAQYVEFMREYRELGHMSPVKDAAASITRYYIPHLPVLRPDSSTTQCRIVFNASARNNSGVSLNECLLNGGELQPPLFNTLLNHRKYVIAFAADISKMYRQISMNEHDRRWQTILWRDSVNEPITEWELCTLTYGERPASFIAKKCLQKLAETIPDSDYEIANAISSEFLMDDLLTGADTVGNAITKQAKIHSSLLAAKFPLRKYVANSPEFISSLDPALVEKLRTVEFASTGVAKLLGLIWNPVDDVYQVLVKIHDVSKVTITKRIVSSLIASIYDPLGFVSPVLIRGKILLQDLWREEIEWDQPVSSELAVQFRAYYASLHSLPSIRIPRPYPTGPFEIIGFCDASVQAYGAVLYARSQTSVTIICAKSKVAPLKPPLTIPRLELTGASLLASLTKRVAAILKIDLATCRMFCDSTIALAWLKGPASKYETFVRNRINYVTSIVPVENWNYVNTSENPADLLTRGLTPSELAKNELWLRGPAWLETLGTPRSEISLPSDPPERRRSQSSKAALATVYVSEELIDKYSSYDKLVRVTLNVITFANRLRKLPNCTTRQATDAILRNSQAVWFAEEITALRAKASVNSKSSIATLEPFLDANGVLRCAGRLSNASLPYDTRHPAILHCRSKLAKLLARYIHATYAHATQSFVIAFLQRRYYLVNGGTKLVKATIKRCAHCSRMSAKAVEQIMGDLPAQRTHVARPFTNTGVDFAGPFTIRCTNHRTQKHLKHYAAFFICLTTRAVHIESVADLSTEAFMSALQRFTARRGMPRTIWSDNATNFVGAANIVARSPATYNIDWRFIPARSPHHGGIWEAAVKSGKRHLLSISKGSVMTEDQFKTSLASVEAIMNSRPLYRRKLQTEYDTIDVITPAHFLVHSELLTPDVPDANDLTLFDRHHAQRQLIQQFWSAWKKSYVTSLHRKSKWAAVQPNLLPGDVVLLKEQTSPLSWPLAKVIETTPDRKGRVRIIRVRAKGSEFSRSVQQVVKLPVEDDSDTDGDTR